MKNIPTKEELIGYLKSDKKTIISTVGIFILLFVLLLAYSIYATFLDLREEEELFLSQEEIVEILEREPEEVSARDIREIEEALEEERYAFGILVERDDQTFYNHPELITELLISEEVVAYVEESIGREILPSPELAVEVSEDSNTRILEIVIGTADEEDNILIAQAYYQAVQEEGLIPPLDDKAIYMMDDEPFLIEIETWMDLVLAEIQFVNPIRAVMGLIFMIGFGLLAGVVIVLVKTMFRKEIPFLYELKEEESDKILYFNQLREIETEEKFRKLTHAILTFPHQKKIVLSQHNIDEKFSTLLEDRIKSENLKDVLVLNDFEESSINTHVDEIIILVEQNKTTKTWYKNQRIQLDRIKVPVTILNY